MKKILLAAAMGAAFAATAQANTQTASDAAQPAAQEAAFALPEPMIVDADMDLEKTMKTMGKNFKALNKADNILAMSKEAKELATYASQAEAVGLNPKKASDEAKAEFTRMIQQLRLHIDELEKAIEAKDAEKAKAALEATNAVRKEGHKYFDV
ncbi:MAG: cytochrome b562 [Cardiobacteriaceae bacterium]|nr:cytochrome b562 [Cardiobacteriaceae bacterium]